MTTCGQHVALLLVQVNWQTCGFGFIRAFCLLLICMVFFLHIFYQKRQFKKDEANSGRFKAFLETTVVMQDLLGTDQFETDAADLTKRGERQWLRNIYLNSLSSLIRFAFAAETPLVT